MLFNASERKGVFILLFLILLIGVIPRQFLAKKPDFFLLPVDISGDIALLKTDSNLPKPSKAFPIKAKANPSVELNTADSSALVKINGIGPYYASKIIRYRERLGGYYSVTQLKDLKMKYFNVDSCASLFTVNPALIQIADLDTMSFKAVLHHPYLEYSDVQLIFNAKQKYGHLSFHLLEEHKVLTPYKLKKIKPYFK